MCGNDGLGTDSSLITKSTQSIFPKVSWGDTHTSHGGNRENVRTSSCLGTWKEGGFQACSRGPGAFPMYHCGTWWSRRSGRS